MCLAVTLVLLCWLISEAQHMGVLKERSEQPSETMIASSPGAVRSVKETLNSQFVENCKGVIQRLTLQEHKMVWNRTTHLW